jgi:hypothetical protein
MQINDDLLRTYAAGEADAQARAVVEAAMADDAAVRDRVEAYRRRRGARSGALAGASSEQMPGRLAAGRGDGSAGRPSRPAEVVDLAAVRALRAAPKATPRSRRTWIQWGAIAACLAMGVVMARGLSALGAAPMMADRHGTLLAQGALAHALDQQIPGSSSAADKSVKIGMTFRAADKIYCRVFQVLRGDELAGLACRSPGGWQIRVATASPGAGGYRPASPLPPAVSASVDALIEGAPLDAQALTAAKTRGWRE